MSDIRTMRMCKVLEENPGASERLDVEHLWELDEMVGLVPRLSSPIWYAVISYRYEFQVKSFPKVAECIGQVAVQEVTLLVNNTVCRKRKHVP
ncbi:unnamed protein product [Cylicostephanus goldi]|uniref:Uncharacterized protein n=1 Tax=Cylicostephanus goldi TaxID=71465 RepID=A0A3P7QRL4_CYLGO|nr:unnamed protein product [Cylicostephanus goldi]